MSLKSPKDTPFSQISVRQQDERGGDEACEAGQWSAGCCTHLVGAAASVWPSAGHAFLVTLRLGSLSLGDEGGIVYGEVVGRLHVVGCL